MKTIHTSKAAIIAACLTGLLALSACSTAPQSAEGKKDSASHLGGHPGERPGQ